MYADKFIEAARAQDMPKTEALLKEAGVRGDLKASARSVEAGNPAGEITITILHQ